MTSQCQCMTPQRLITAAKLRFALHNLAKKEKNENRCCFEAHSKVTEVVTFHTHELMGHV